MKNYRNFVLLLLLTGFMMVGVQSCSQYEDNTSISLVSKTERLSRVWKVENYKVDSVDLTSLMAAYTETFTKNGAYSFQWAILGGTATWAFQNGSADIKITNVNNVTSRTFTILRLEEDALWYYYMDGDSRVEFHMVPQ
jgi:hypothetical protein